MKRVCIVRDECSFWSLVENSLRGVNVESTTFDSDGDLEGILSARPDLIIIHRSGYDRLHRSLRQTPMIVITGDGRTDSGDQPDFKGKTVGLSWPEDRNRLLEVTSRLLGVAARRKFRALLRVFHEGDDFGAIAESVDVSLTGLAFRTDRIYEPWQTVEVSLSLPNNREGIRFRTEIARVTPGRETVHYGARYLSLPPDIESIVRSFVLGC